MIFYTDALQSDEIKPALEKTVEDNDMRENGKTDKCIFRFAL